MPEGGGHVLFGEGVALEAFLPLRIPGGMGGQMHGLAGGDFDLGGVAAVIDWGLTWR
jgi:hypothetical protein